MAITNKITGIDEPLYEYLHPALETISSYKGSRKAQDHLRQKLQNFVRRTGSAAYDINPDLSGGFDKVWILDFGRTVHRHNNQGSIYLIGVNTTTQEIEALKIVGSKQTFQEAEASIASYFKQNKEKPFPAVGQAPTQKRRAASLEAVIKTVSHQKERTAGSLRDNFQTSLRSKENETLGASFLDALQKKTTKLLEEQLQNVLDAFMALIDTQSLEWAGDIRTNPKVSEQYTEFDIYNHIVNAAVPQIRGYRYTALRQFAPLGSLFLDLPVWDEIDKGRPPMDILAAYMKVAPATLKRMAKNPDLFALGDVTQVYAPFLDALDPSFWPTSHNDLFYFKTCKSAADLYQKFFDKNGPATMSSWIKTHKGGKAKEAPSTESLWASMAFHLLKEDINSYLNPAESQKSRVLCDLSRNSRKKLNAGKKTRLDRFSDIPANLLTKKEIWPEALNLMKNSIATIRDMKDDISKRLIAPALLLELERHGCRISEPSILDGLAQKCAETLWAGMAPADQIAANRYWHSPHVNITTRFRTAALTNSSYEAWPGLFPKEGDNKIFKEIYDGVVFHPLLSNTALQEEGQAMSHCIGGYGSYFFTRNFHYFSLRDENGNRLSSLTVQDLFDSDGHRIIRASQHRAALNQDPVEKAMKAARTLIEAINEGKIVPDWPAIDEARAYYKTREIENAAGYDIRDAARRQAVFDIYEPCLPNKLIRKTDRTYEGFLQALGISAHISTFLEGFDFLQGGLVRIPQDKAPRLQNASDHPQPDIG